MELPHNVRAMELHCSFLGAEMRGDLFVEQTFHHKPEDLRLARRQRDQPMLQLAANVARLAKLAALNEAGRYSAEKIVFIEWLEQEIRCSTLHACYAALDVGESRHQDDRNRTA